MVSYQIDISAKSNLHFATKGIDTYDGKSKLKDGICFGNKLYSPMNGSAFNIENGHPELAPAIDELPRFHVEEVTTATFLFTSKNPGRKHAVFVNIFWPLSAMGK